MTKSLIEQVLENAAHTVPCPGCQHTPGLEDSPRNQMGPGSNGVHKRGRYQGCYRSAMPLCKLCRGGGVVYLNRICECGWPAVLLDQKEKVWSCGSTACITQAAWKAKHPGFIPSSSSSSSFSASGAYAPMLPPGASKEDKEAYQKWWEGYM